MIYSVEISGQAEKDLKGIYEYISFVLFSPVNVAKQLQQIITAISKLDYMPERYRKYEKEPWRSRGLRQMPVNNYIIFYTVNDQTHIVTVTAVMYKKRDHELHFSSTMSVLHDRISEFVYQAE